jgi:hypothetical protein
VLMCCFYFSFNILFKRKRKRRKEREEEKERRGEIKMGYIVAAVVFVVMF